MNPSKGIPINPIEILRPIKIDARKIVAHALQANQHA